MAKVIVVCVVVLCCAGRAVAEPPAKESQEWRVLLVIKPETDLKMEDNPLIKTRMADDNVAAVKKAFVEHTPYWVAKVSEGRLRWKAEAVVSPTPVTAVTEIGKGSFWLAPWNIPEDIQKFVPRAAYDGVFVYWKAVDDKGRGVNAGFGWSIGPNDNANHCGYSCVHYVDTALWGRDSEFTEVFLHEWQHQLEAFYSAKGVKLPKGGLHVDASYGYKHHASLFWKPWYKDFLAGNVREPDGSRTGLGEKAWSLGTIREEQRIFTPEYLTAEVRRQNLLRNGSFEAEAGDWAGGSWRGNAKAAAVVPAKAHDGKQAALLQSDLADDACFKQAVRVKPKTKYLFCGWVKTQDVTITDKGATAGANLSVLGGFERSPARLTGTTDWTYLSFVFDSGERTTVEVAARLGHHASLASGRAWFDDLCLIEFPERKPSK